MDPAAEVLMMKATRITSPVCLFLRLHNSKGMFRNNNSQILLNVLIIFGFQEWLFMETHVRVAVQHFLSSLAPMVIEVDQSLAK